MSLPPSFDPGHNPSGGPPAAPAGPPPSFAPRGAPGPGAPAAPPQRPRTPVPPAPSVPGAPPGARPPGARPPGRRRRVVVWTLVVVLVLALAWPVGLVIWANGRIQRVDGLNLHGGGPGTTYLIAGSDERDGGIADDGTTGSRADTILLLHVPDRGPTSLISLPRDTYVQIPGHGGAKLNAATVYGGAALLVTTVEELTGMKIDHYVEIGMGGVKDVVDAVGGVELCWDADVDDRDSQMVWTAGCHTVDGAAALAFSRMRKSDPTGDIGRGLRQRQVVGAVMNKVNPTSLVFRPDQQVALASAGTSALRVDGSTNIVTLGRL
ncbi:MAG: LCP family protein, partial [Micrococcales bacterium]|nr:LCP family protein [Micrococcales bacterium]